MPPWPPPSPWPSPRRWSGLPETSSGAIAADAGEQVRALAADASSVLVGPGLSDAGGAAGSFARSCPSVHGALAVDALALAALTDDPECLTAHVRSRRPEPERRRGRTRPALRRGGGRRGPGRRSRGRGHRDGLCRVDGRRRGLHRGARRAAVAGRQRRCRLGVSGSGDVRAGVVAGLLARGSDAPQAAVWAAHLHGRAGERLASTVGRIGFLARDLPGQSRRSWLRSSSRRLTGAPPQARRPSSALCAIRRRPARPPQQERTAERRAGRRVPGPAGVGEHAAGPCAARAPRAPFLTCRRMSTRPAGTSTTSARVPARGRGPHSSGGGT